MPKEQINLDAEVLEGLRIRLREAAESIKFDEDVTGFLQSRRVNALPFSVMPDELVGIMEIIVPAEGDRANDSSVSVKSTPHLLALYATEYQPNFHSTPISDLTPYLLGVFMSYVNAHFSYMTEQVAIVGNQLAVAKRRHVWARNHMRAELLKVGVKSHTANLLADTDPYIEELQHQVDLLEALHARYAAAAKGLESVYHAASRDVTRRQNDPSSRVYTNTPANALRPEYASLLGGK